MAAKQKKKFAEAKPKAQRQEKSSIVFTASMIGSKPKVTSAASEQKKTRQAEAESRKRKLKDTSDDAPSKKKLKTKTSKSSKKERSTAPEPLYVEPISVALPASTNQQRRVVIHEPASPEAPASEDIPVVDPLAAEDIGHEDNGNDDEVLPQFPQIEPNPVSSPAPTSSEQVSIGHPLTPFTQDEIPRTPPAQLTSQVLDDDYMEQTTPSPKASPSFRRLRKGLSPQVSMSSIPEEDVQNNSSLEHKVFPKATPSVSASES